MAHYLVIVESPAKVKTIKKVFGQQLYSCGFSGTCTGSSEKFTWNRCRTRLRTKIHYNKGKRRYSCGFAERGEEVGQSISGN